MSETKTNLLDLDRDAMRAFFADKAGVRPERRVEPYLAEEGRSAP